MFSKKNKTTRITDYILVVLFFTLAIFGKSRISLATDYTSSHYILRDPVLSEGAGYASSSTFQYLTSIGQAFIGESTSTSFINRSGFLYYSTVTNPVLSGTAGDTTASLSWTASTGSLGVNISAYEVGVSTTSGSGYTFTNVGNVLTRNVTGLTNGVTYYIVVRALDALGDDVALSNQITVTPASSGGGGGGGGSSGGGQIATGIRFSGYAYPLSEVTILKDGDIVVQTIAGGDAQFSVRLSDLASGSYNFSVYGTDKDGIRSTPFSFPVFITQGATVDITGIFITPTIDTDKSQVKQGDDIVIFGQTTPESNVTIQVNSNNQLFANATSDRNGVYLYNFNTAPLELGNHSTKSKTLLENGQSSGYGRQIGFVVGNENVLKEAGVGTCHADLNDDARVNLTDFSIAAFWYKKTLNTSIIEKEKNCLNGDGIINLTDFSIMAFYWTG